MNIEDEIKQINEIINKLEIIQDDEWQQKVEETDEEYNERIESIEEELEEELLDYISDSLLDEQKINEEEAIKEAQEKIKSDYRLFSEAFVENENGIIKLRNKEELVLLGYSTTEEIEKLKEIENNINNPEQYLNKIKENIKESKDIDSEIDKKMELAKSIISARKRGESVPSSLNPNLEKDKFEKANEYIVNTATLKRIPVIQSEYINNNYISERRYNNAISNINTTNMNISSNRVTTTVTQIGTPVVSIQTQKIVTKSIPERKNEIYTNFEKKLDKDNSLTKQKIKARTELKSIFKEIEDKELTKEELKELNLKIEIIKKKYPNTVTDKILDKLYDTFKVKLPTEEVKKQAQVEPFTPKIKQKVTDVALGIGEAIGMLKQKSETVIENIVQQQKKTRKKRVTQPKKREGTTQTKEIPKTVSKNPEISREELMKSLKKAEQYDTKDIHAKGINLLVINKLISYLKYNDDPKIQEILNKEIVKLQTDRYGVNDALYIYNFRYTNPQTLNYMYECYRDGVKSDDGNRDIIPANKNAASYYLYLTYNVMQNFNKAKNNAQQQLETNLKEVDTRKIYAESLEDGAEKAKELEIIKSYINEAEKNKRYLERYKNIERIWNLPHDFSKKVNDNFKSKVEEICYRYFEFLKEKYNKNKFKGIERLKEESYFISELKTANQFEKENTEYLNLAISKEFISRIAKDKKKFLNKIQEIEKKNKRGERINSRVLKLLGDFYYNGIKSASDQEIIKQDKRKAIKIYEQIINGKEISNADTEIYNNLIETYSDNTTPLYDKCKADKIQEIAARKGLYIQRKSTKSESKEPSIYVCSDLHGEYPVYKAIISQLKEKDKLYILGDVIDRGPDGIKILQDMKKRKKQIEFLIGNHEFSMIRTLFYNNKQSGEIWSKNGGDTTKEDFEKLDIGEQNEIKEFLLDSYVYKNIKVNFEEVHLVHAKAVQDKNDNSTKMVREMMTEGKEKLILEAVEERQSEQTAKPETFTVIGHTPTFSMIEYNKGFLDIDCGVSYGYNASLVNLTQGTVKYIDAKYEREKEKNEPKEK